MTHTPHSAEVWSETVLIPTYEAGQPDQNPLFLENRVYQGSSGKVYPLPVVERISDEKADKPYTAVFLENDYLRIMVLPQLGGRIQRALDKTNGYDFVYHNEVIKPALVGLTGPWISGGIEFNWPQHHRPTTFSPLDWRLVEHDDGSRSVELSEVDQMYGTKGKMTFTIYPDKAYLEVRGQLYNRTCLPQTFLWWANPAVAVNDDTQSVFPPDVHAVFDHGKRDVSAFPIATGVYYKHDYGAGVDISRYRNIPVPTSYMCAHSDYDFVGHYDAGAQAGLLHVADHHVSPGKKQWTWGNGDFGRAWERNLTDANGPYIELMTGVYCDNQPDFTWLKPFEEKTFTQYFMPYKACGAVKNASRECAVNLETQPGRASVWVYATAAYPGACVRLTASGQPLLDCAFSLSPTDVFAREVATNAPPHTLTLEVFDASGRRMIAYTPKPRAVEPIPDPMPAVKPPADIRSVEELYLTGVHLEQYRHATWLPDPYYLEALRRDPGDSRANNAYGLLLLRRGLFKQSEKYFRAAVERVTLRNPNPEHGTPYANLGLCLLWQNRFDEAYDAFYKAAWSADEQETAYYYLACIDCRRGDWETALEHAGRSLIKNGHHLKARALRGLILSRLGREEEALAQWNSNLKLDAFDYVSRLAMGDAQGAIRLMNGRASTLIECAADFAEAGFWAQAVETLGLYETQDPMVYYHRAYYAAGWDESLCEAALDKAAGLPGTCCFPNRLEDIRALTFAMERRAQDARAPYYLGCLWYDRRQYDQAVALWERSAQLDGTFPTVWRNLALAYYNKRGDRETARRCMERAFALDPSDARVLMELDQLCRRLRVSPQERLDFLLAHRETAFARDDLYAECCELLNLTLRPAEALELLLARSFHPWEGGEGKVMRQYAAALEQLGREALQNGRPQEARERFEQALRFPRNLGEGKLEGAKDNRLYYLLGLAARAMGEEEQAVACLERACEGSGEPAGMLYYNDQPADRILYEGLAHRALGREDRAKGCFHKLIAYGEKHYFDTVQPDYFAVSLPDLQIFDDDLTLRNRAHCEYLIGLGSYGLGDVWRARECYDATLRLDPSHQGAAFHKRLLDKKQGGTYANI